MSATFWAKNSRQSCGVRNPTRNGGASRADNDPIICVGPTLVEILLVRPPLEPRWQRAHALVPCQHYENSPSYSGLMRRFGLKITSRRNLQQCTRQCVAIEVAFTVRNSEVWLRRQKGFKISFKVH